MFDKIKSIFKEKPKKKSLDSDVLPQEIRLAAASLMLQIAQSDGKVDERERELFYRFIEEQLGTTIAAVENFIATTNNENSLINLFHMTRLLKDNLDYKSLSQIVSMLQAISYADGGINGFEEQKVGQIAELLGVEIAPPLSS